MKNWLKAKIDAAVEKDATIIPFTPQEKRQIKRRVGVAVFWGILGLACLVVSMLQTPPAVASWGSWVVLMLLCICAVIGVCIGVVAQYVRKLAEGLAASRDRADV